MYLYGCDFSDENTLCTMFRSSCKNALHIVLYYTEVLHECNANQNQHFPSLSLGLIRYINHLGLDKRKSNIAQSQQIIESLYI